ncbi:hypothetical protein BVY01_05315 [bacterium I07]|nr:hypothetical protein BVY01_05315 [bacterium I07]
MIKLNLPKDIFLILCDPCHKDYNIAWRSFFKDYGFENYLKAVIYYEFEKYNLNYELIDDFLGDLLRTLCQRLYGKETKANKDDMGPYIGKIVKNLITDGLRKQFRKKIITVPIENDFKKD